MSIHPHSTEISKAAEQILASIRSDLLELEPAFSVDDDLFSAGLDSMSIMQVILLVEENFAIKIPDALIKRETFSSARCIAEAVLSQRL
jgi:acyl carrier protein